MKLEQIDKAIYRKRLNIIIACFITSLLALALIFGQGLIALFGEAPIAAQALSDGADQPNNFRFNLLGVVLALITCALVLHRLRSSEFFAEVYYVWQVKQLQNLIYRKLKVITKAADNDDVNALIILKFYYTSLQQTYTLDDNTLTMSKVNSDLNKVQQQIDDKSLTISVDQFEKSLLADYK